MTHEEREALRRIARMLPDGFGGAVLHLLTEHEELERKFAAYRKSAEEGAEAMGRDLTAANHAEQELERKVREFVKARSEVDERNRWRTNKHPRDMNDERLTQAEAALRAAVEEK